MKTAYIFVAYAVAIVFFFLFRLLFLFVSIYSGNVQADFGSELAKSFLIGLQFDSCVCCYLLSLPLIGVLTGEVFRLKSKLFYKIIHILTCTLFCVAFLICSADIPYYNNFFSHLNASVFSYFSTFGFLIKMIFQEVGFLIYFFLFVVVCIGYVLLMNLNYRRTICRNIKPLSLVKAIPLALVCLCLCAVGMRGRLAAKSPLRVGTAYHCNDAFLNNLGLNPAFVLFKSIEETSKQSNQGLHLVSSSFADKVWKEQIEKVKTADSLLQLPEGTNVVLIIMEGMSAEHCGHFNPQSTLTPCLDKLLALSLSYENAYTAGIHTYNGVYSTLFSHPALFDRHSMKTTCVPQMCGLPNNLADRGYQTLYFTTHDAQFDNISGFLYANGIQKIISQTDYPHSQVKSTLGVSDHLMYQKAIQTLSSLDKSKPFFVCMLSASNHPPYILPDDIPFKPQSRDIKQQMVEYADWALGNFVSQAQKQDWFANTLFVFVADHGYAKPSSLYQMPLSYHHTPMFLYYPTEIAPQRDSSLALQIDLTPTVLSMLFSDYQNHTLGVDLQRVERQYAYFCADDKVGVLDRDYFYICERQGGEFLYRLGDSTKHNHISDCKEKAEQMKHYAFSMMQKSNDMLKNSTTSCK